MDILNEDSKILRKGFEIKSDESKPQEKKQNVYLYRDIFEATGKEYPKRIDCPSCKEKDRAEFRHGPYGVTSGTPGFAGYFCPECKGMIYIDPNTLFLCHPGSFMTSLDVLKAQYQKFDKPVGEVLTEEPLKKDDPERDFVRFMLKDTVSRLEASKGRPATGEEKEDIVEQIWDSLKTLHADIDWLLEKI